MGEGFDGEVKWTAELEVEWRFPQGVPYLNLPTQAFLFRRLLLFKTQKALR